MGNYRQLSSRMSVARRVFFCILFCVGVMVAVGLCFWYWNQNDFMPDAQPGTPLENKPATQ